MRGLREGMTESAWASEARSCTIHTNGHERTATHTGVHTHATRACKIQTSRIRMKGPRMPDPALREDTAPSSHPRAHPHTAFTCALRCEGDPTNRRRPPAAPGNASPHPCRCPDSRRAPTPHLRTPYAGTARAHTSSRAPSRSLETGFSAYGSRARATPAIRPRTVHMTWDREA